MSAQQPAESPSEPLSVEKLRDLKNQLIATVDSLPEMKGRSWRKPIKLDGGISVTLAASDNVTHQWGEGGPGEIPVDKEGTMFNFKVDKKGWGNMWAETTTEDKGLWVRCFPKKGRGYDTHITLDPVRLEAAQERLPEAVQILQEALEGTVSKIKEGETGEGAITRLRKKVFKKKN